MGSIFKTTKEQATAFFAEFFGGEHHMPSRGVREFGPGWCVNVHMDLATFDHNRLTQLVFLAHDRCFRVAIMPSGPGLVRIAIWRREGRNVGAKYERHPTIETALAEWRERNPAPAE